MVHLVTLRELLADADYNNPREKAMALDLPFEIYTASGKQVILSIYVSGRYPRLVIDVEDEDA